MCARRLLKGLSRPLPRGDAGKAKRSCSLLSPRLLIATPGCLLLLLLLALACKSSDISGPAGSDAAGTPAIEIIAPGPMENISGGSVEVTVAVTDFIMDSNAIGSYAVSGTGHWHLYLNGELVSPSATDSYFLEPIRPGSHHLRVSLANNDHSPLNPPVEDSVVINVASGDTVSESPPVSMYDYDAGY